MHPQYTLYSQDVCTLAINTLASLPLSARGDQGQVRDWLHVLVCAAASRLSIHHACRDLDGAPSNATVLGDLATPLRDLAQLADTRPTLWLRLGPKSLRQRGRRVAIDLLAWPSHGTVDEGHQDTVRRGQATHGTPHFFPSATASVILRGRRYTLALYYEIAQELGSVSTTELSNI